jgi:hypothetical protein
LETGRNSEPNSPCVISASHISELPCSELAGIVKTSKKNKNEKIQNLLKNKKCEKIKTKS